MAGLARGGAPRRVPAPAETKYERLRELGRGSHGSVFLVRRKADRKLFAMKSVLLPPLASSDDKAILQRKQALREVDILRMHESPHIMAYEEAILAPASTDRPQSELHIVTEYCDGGDLSVHLRKVGGSGLPEGSIWKFATSMLYGLRDLHAQSVLHRDLKPANIFLKRTAIAGPAVPAGQPRACSACSASHGRSDCGTEEQALQDFTVLVGDLGVAREMSNSQPLASTMVGTPLYCAPEIFEGQSYGEKADIYSFGVCVYELMHGRPPFAEVTNMGALVRMVLNLDGKPDEVRLPMDRQYSPKLRGYVTSCLALSPEQRPTVAELISGAPELQVPTPCQAVERLAAHAELTAGIDPPPSVKRLARHSSQPRVALARSPSTKVPLQRSPSLPAASSRVQSPRPSLGKQAERQASPAGARARMPSPGGRFSFQPPCREAKHAEAKAAKAKEVAAKAALKNAATAKEVEVKAAEAKAAEAEVAKATAVEAKAAEVKAAEEKAAMTNEAQAKVAEVTAKAADVKEAEAKVAAANAAKAKEAEAKVAEPKAAKALSIACSRTCVNPAAVQSVATAAAAVQSSASDAQASGSIAMQNAPLKIAAEVALSSARVPARDSQCKPIETPEDVAEAAMSSARVLARDSPRMPTKKSEAHLGRSSSVPALCREERTASIPSRQCSPTSESPTTAPKVQFGDANGWTAEVSTSSAAVADPKRAQLDEVGDKTLKPMFSCQSLELLASSTSSVVTPTGISLDVNEAREQENEMGDTGSPGKPCLVPPLAAFAPQPSPIPVGRAKWAGAQSPRSSPATPAASAGGRHSARFLRSSCEGLSAASPAGQAGLRQRGKAYVAKAQECWSRWRRERVEGRKVEARAAASSGKSPLCAGQHRVLAEAGDTFGLEVRGVAPPQAPANKRVARSSLAAARVLYTPPARRAKGNRM